MSKFDSVICEARKHIPEGIDACVSFVLFGNDKAEVINAISQVASSSSECHVIIIDNTTPPMDLDFARSMGAYVISTSKNIGYGRGHNIALIASKGKCRYNIVMNTDLQVNNDAIGGMIGFMDRNPDAGLAMPKVLYPDGSLQRLCRLLPDPIDLLGRRVLRNTQWAKTKNERYEFHNWDYNSVAEFPFLSGCFMICRQSILDKVGYFDERYFLYAEDLDLSRRINAVSKTLYNPEQSVIHEYRSQSRPSLKRIRYASVSLAKYFFKWGWALDPGRDRINRNTINQFF